MTNEQIFEELIQLEMVFREGKLRDEARLMARKRRTLLIDLLKVNQEEAATSAALQALCRAWEDELAGQTPEIELGSCLQGLDYPPDPTVMAEKLKIAAAAELGRQIAYRSPERNVAAVVFREAMRGRPQRMQSASPDQTRWVDMLPARKPSQLGQKGPGGQMSMYYKMGKPVGFVVEWTSDLQKACHAVEVSLNLSVCFYCFLFKGGLVRESASASMKEAKIMLEEHLEDLDSGEDSDSDPPSGGDENVTRPTGGQP